MKSFEEYTREIDQLLANGTPPDDICGWFDTDQLEEFIVAFAMTRKPEVR